MHHREKWPMGRIPVCPRAQRMSRRTHQDGCTQTGKVPLHGRKELPAFISAEPTGGREIKELREATQPLTHPENPGPSPGGPRDVTRGTSGRTWRW